MIMSHAVIGGIIDGLMISALDSGSSDLGSNAGRGHCVVLLGKTLHSLVASLHPWVIVRATQDKNAGGLPAMD